MITLYDLEEGEEGIITKIKGRGRFRQRLMEMGFIAGKKVSVIKKAPLGDPVEYRIIEYYVSLRSSEAKLIEIDRNGKPGSYFNNGFQEEFNYTDNTWQEKSRNLVVALVGNPNSGKTTLFNWASGAREKVANYPGVTVDLKTAKYRQSGYTFSLVDLPGTYSLKSYSPEEIYLRNFLMENKPDVVINILDAGNLERNLYLTTQLIDMGIQSVIALNMYDELEKKGDRLDHGTLGRLLGIPVIPTVSSRGRGINDLFDKVIEVYENREPAARHIHINYGPELEEAVKAIQEKIKIEENRDLTNIISSRYLAIELLGGDPGFQKSINGCVNHEEIISIANSQIEKLRKLFSEPVEDLITDLKYGFIAGALKETLEISEKEGASKSDKIDNYLTHRFLGIPIFAAFMWLTFYTTFRLGGYPKHWLEVLIGDLSHKISQVLPPGIVSNFICGGIIGGVGGVLVFLPNLIILFLFISFMEDTGYMARAVFIMDRLMHRIGLHGKSFIPLFMGFGCNVPAIMATRIIESRRDRLITMLITPFMSCSARLPVYILFISAFFSSQQGTVLFVLYLLGALFAIFSAIILKRVFFRKEDIPFVMELPPYRLPSPRNFLKHISFRTGLYLRKIGGVILLASIIVWILTNFPRKIGYSRDFDGMIAGFENKARMAEGKISADSDRLMILKLEREKRIETQRSSYMGIIGRTIEPVMKPLGLDWRLSVSVLSGIAAKEVVVSTLGVICQADDKTGNNSLVERIRDQKDLTGKNVFTPLIAFSFMLFILTYFPCVGVVAAIRRESGSWKWAAFVVIYTTAVAWLLSFTVFQIGSLFI
ncbi:MAG TPA: ferrous iron transport protein B [Bacteroidales bacterium]|nr:ferrous iron transport protein B [Bacteroidales bacterium]